MVKLYIRIEIIRLEDYIIIIDKNLIMCNNVGTNEYLNLQGRVKFPTGGYSPRTVLNS